MNKKEKDFIKTVKEHYKRHGRRNLPWRNLPADRQGTRDPYRILVSEVMLQQTQVDRVIPKYEAFLDTFPNVQTLADAPLGAVLREWQGLGYNRRAKMLHDCAKVILSEFKGVFPEDPILLMKFPGVGPYTAGAIMAFAFNKPIPIIETNIRSAYLHHFFNDSTDVLDTELIPYIERTLDLKNPRAWYAALMDYGTFIKKSYGNPNSKSKHYVRQSAFKGSDREIRGAILRQLAHSSMTRTKALQTFDFEDIRIDAQLEKLLAEKLIILRRGRYALPE